MADTLNLPGLGPVKKTWAIGGAAVVAGILAVAYYRHRANAGTAAAAAAAAQPDPNAIDPATGLTYGEEAAGIQAGDLAGAGTPYGDTSGIVGYDAQGNPIYADQVGYGPSPSFTSNGAWSQAAQQYLVSATGADAGTVAAALGAYINGQTLSSAQASVVQQAIAFFGQPPDQGSDGYPPALRLAGPPGANVAVPGVVGQAASSADAKIKAAGLVPIADPGQKPTDKVTSTTPKAGTHVQHGSQVLVTAAPAAGAHAGEVQVPKVTGRTADQAKAALEHAGLKAAGIPAGRLAGHTYIVTAESPRAGTWIKKESTVKLTVTVKKG
jgi:hypothetical protein